jgi:hypothetical protein
MTLNTGVNKLKAEIETLEEAISKADPQPMIVYIVNDPERRHAGPDEAEIGGEAYLRGEGEDRGCFEARLRAAAVAAGARVVCVSLADLGPGPFLDDLRIEDLDETKTIEIGATAQA